jgi:hypothetical protein
LALGVTGVARGRARKFAPRAGKCAVNTAIATAPSL